MLTIGYLQTTLFPLIFLNNISGIDNIRLSNHCYYESKKCMIDQIMLIELYFSQLRIYFRLRFNITGAHKT